MNKIFKKMEESKNDRRMLHKTFVSLNGINIKHSKDDDLDEKLKLNERLVDIQNKFESESDKEMFDTGKEYGKVIGICIGGLTAFAGLFIGNMIKHFKH